MTEEKAGIIAEEPFGVELCGVRNKGIQERCEAHPYPEDEDLPQNAHHRHYDGICGTYGSGKPVIGILGEYDALPNLSQKGRR